LPIFGRLEGALGIAQHERVACDRGHRGWSQQRADSPSVAAQIAMRTARRRAGDDHLVRHHDEVDRRIADELLARHPTGLDAPLGHPEVHDEGRFRWLGGNTGEGRKACGIEYAAAGWLGHTFLSPARMLLAGFFTTAPTSHP